MEQQEKLKSTDSSGVGVDAPVRPPQTVTEWAKDIIEGCGGMNDYEEHELVVWNESERVEAAIWAIRCLANPNCPGADVVLQEIIKKRNESA